MPRQLCRIIMYREGSFQNLDTEERSSVTVLSTMLKMRSIYLIFPSGVVVFPWRNLWGPWTHSYQYPSSCGSTCEIYGGLQAGGSSMALLPQWISEGPWRPQYGQSNPDHWGAAKKYGWSCGGWSHCLTNRIAGKRGAIQNARHLKNTSNVGVWV